MILFSVVFALRVGRGGYGGWGARFVAVKGGHRPGFIPMMLCEILIPSLACHVRDEHSHDIPSSPWADMKNVWVAKHITALFLGPSRMSSINVLQR